MKEDLLLNVTRVISVFFRRPDGRVIPVSGYQLADFMDTDVGSVKSMQENSREFSECAH